MRSFCRSGKVTVRLLTSKSRAAPIKTETIPRLELLGNVLLSRLITSVKNALKNCVNFDKIYLWIDSKVTLSRDVKSLAGCLTELSASDFY